MQFLYGSKRGGPNILVATFDSEPQLLAYVRWAILQSNPNDTYKFEQGSALASYDRFERSSSPLTSDDAAAVLHNPSPSML
jgi:hypothetical protein